MVYTLLPYEERLVDFLCKERICDLLIPSYLSRDFRLQNVFVDLMTNRKEICISRGRMGSVISRIKCPECPSGYLIFKGEGTNGSMASYQVGYCSEGPVVTHSTIRKALIGKPVYPFFLFDASILSFFGSPGEEKEAVIILSHALQLIRQYLYDTNIVVTSASESLIDEIDRTIIEHDMIITDKTSADTLWEAEAEEVVLISPLAKKRLSINDVRKSQAIIIPLVLYWDERMWKYLSNLVPWARIRRLELESSSYKIPHRPTSVMKTILDALYNDVSLDKAILENMDHKSLYRLVKHEIRKLVWDTGETRVDYIYDKLSWIGVRRNLVEKALWEVLMEEK
jgi:Trm5-related predicted tRNA methylase